MGDELRHAHCFVVCAYKDNPYLGETIESVLDQTIESNVILSTSTPSTYIERVCDEHGIKMFVNPDPRSAGDDWNFGYDKADAKLVTIVHQDDRYEPEFLERTLAYIGANGGIENLLLAFTDYYEIRDGLEVEDNGLLRIKRIMNAPFRSRFLCDKQVVKRRILSFGDSICCPSVTLAKQNLGNSVFDTSYRNSCDYRTWVDLASMPGKFVYVPEKLMGHRIYAESATTLNLADNIRKKEDQEILESLWPAPIAHLINKAYSLSEKSNELDQ